MKPKFTRKFFLDLAERVLWTAVQAVIAFLLVTVADWDFEWVPILTAFLSFLKGFLAQRIGDPESAATLRRELG